MIENDVQPEVGELETFVMALFVILTPNTPITQQITLVHSFAIPKDIQSFTLPSASRTQIRTIPTTGRGHQDATYARGTITFYNGLFTGQTIAQGTILTGADGVQVVTDQDALLPAANPPLFGQVSVPAHALHVGIKGNIPSYAVDDPCCATSVKVVNRDFTGGRDARNFPVVARKDIEGGALSLAQSLYGQEQKALHAGPDATVIPLPCSSTVTSNHHAGEEAATVKVMVAATCSGIAYSRTSLQEKARELLHIPTDYRMTSLSVHVVRTTPTSVLVAIKYTMLYDFTERNRTERNEQIY